MKVSVITPAYNASATLQRAHDSLVRQSHSDWEQIIVDDGSTDGTAKMIRELQRDPRVRPTRIPNSGTGAALNTGTAMATADLLAFLDADDEFLPQHLQAHVAILLENPAVDLLWGGAEIVVKRPEDAWIPDVVKGHGLIHAAECVIQGTLFGRRHVFERVKYSEDRSIWFQDYEFFVRASAQFSTQRFPLPTYRYYRNSQGSTIDRVKANWTR